MLNAVSKQYILLASSELYNFFLGSTHRWEVLTNNVSDGMYVIKSLSSTRRSVRGDATKALGKGYSSMPQRPSVKATVAFARLFLSYRKIHLSKQLLEQKLYDCNKNYRNVKIIATWNCSHGHSLEQDFDEMSGHKRVITRIRYRSGDRCSIVAETLNDMRAGYMSGPIECKAKNSLSATVQAVKK